LIIIQEITGKFKYHRVIPYFGNYSHGEYLFTPKEENEETNGGCIDSSGQRYNTSFQLHWKDAGFHELCS
jgi:hypothetical protein